MGAAECGNYTGGLKLVAQSFPTRERGLAGGIFNSCTFIGSVVAPILVPWLAIRYSWRAAFVVVSWTGLVWVVVWRFLYPRSLDSQVADENRVKAPGASVRALLKHRQTWGLILLRSLTGPLSQFYWFWLPEYLSTARGLSLEQLGRGRLDSLLLRRSGKCVQRSLDRMAPEARPQCRFQPPAAAVQRSSDYDGSELVCLCGANG